MNNKQAWEIMIEDNWEIVSGEGKLILENFATSFDVVLSMKLEVTTLWHFSIELSMSKGHKDSSIVIYIYILAEII